MKLLFSLGACVYTCVCLSIFHTHEHKVSSLSCFSITLILVENYLSCRIQMYLNHNFLSNPTLSHSRFRYFTADFLYFFIQGSRNTYVSGFSVNLLITTIWVNNHLSPSFFCLHLHLLAHAISPPSLSLCQSSSESLKENLSSLSWQKKVVRFGIFLKFNGLQVYYSVFQ